MIHTQIKTKDQVEKEKQRILNKKLVNLRAYIEGPKDRADIRLRKF